MKIPPEILFTIVFGSILLIALGTFIIVILLQYQKRKFGHKQQMSQLQQSIQQTILQSQLEIKEEVLQQVSEELHDNLSQVASLIKINLLTLQFEDLDDRAKADKKIEDTLNLTRQMIGDLKSLSVSLSGDLIIRTGLVKAIETETKRLNSTGKFIASFQQQGEMPDIDNEKSIILYRMVQEVINNIIKHSGAKHINILVDKAEKLFILALTDNGAGFNVEEKMKSGGAGLLNLQKRAKLINAELSVISTPGTGTEVNIKLPL